MTCPHLSQVPVSTLTTVGDVRASRWRPRMRFALMFGGLPSQRWSQSYLMVVRTADGDSARVKALYVLQTGR